MTVTARKPVKRAFVGMAGSPLAIVKALKEVSVSDHSLREPKTPDREEPIGFNEWWDSFGQRHAEIDLDCDFQTYQFDPRLGGSKPDDMKDRPSHAGGLNGVDEEGNSIPGDAAIIAELQIERRGKKIGAQTGLLERERPVRLRRATDKTWWIFESDLLRDFLKTKFEKDVKRAESAALVIYHYYFRNRQDEEIFDETSLFKDEKSLKNFRQRLVDEGTEIYPESLRPLRRTYNRGRWNTGKQCSDPTCACHKNEASNDFTKK